MTQQYYSIITNAGLLKNAAANAPGGSLVNLTHLAVGDASYNPTGAATALQNERYRTTLTHVVIDENNPNQLIVEAVINETVGPFYIREVGIFDSAGTLFAIGKYPETFKPDLPAGSGKRLYIRMILGFASSPNVELIISDDINNDPNFSTDVNNALANLNEAIATIDTALTQKLVKSQNLSDVSDAVQARTNLGLAIGTNVQAYATNLAALAGLVGSANKIPYFSGVGLMSLIEKGYQLKSVQVFTTSGTWTKPSGVNAIIVEAQGGGGGGRNGLTNSYAGGGGGAGGYALSLITNPSSSEVVTIGGPGGGGSGGTSSFGSLLTATGGNYGNIWYGAAGGQGSGGNILNLKGTAGANSMPMGVTGDSGGIGGASRFGGNGIGNAGGGLASTDVSAKANTGSGGGGGSWTSGAVAPGNGGSGIVIVYELI